MAEPFEAAPASPLAPAAPVAPPRAFAERRHSSGKSSAVKGLANASFTVPFSFVLVWYLNNFQLTESYSPVDGSLIQINGEVGAALGGVLAALFAILADWGERALARRHRRLAYEARLRGEPDFEETEET